MGAPITLSIILPCGEAVAHLPACLDQFRNWRPAPELICVVPEDQPKLAKSLASHPAEPFVMTATGTRASLLAAGVAEAQGSVVLLLDPATRLGNDTHRTIFRSLARAEQGAGFFRIAAREEAAGKPLADPVAITFSGLLHAPLGPGAFFCRTQSLRTSGGIPTGDTLLDFRLARQVGRQTKIIALHEQVESLREGHPDAWHLIGQIIRLLTGTPLSALTPAASRSAMALPAEPAPLPAPVTLVHAPPPGEIVPFREQVPVANEALLVSPSLPSVELPDIVLSETLPIPVDAEEFAIQIESHTEPISTATPIVSVAVEAAEPPSPLAGATPIITAGQAGFDALFMEDSHPSEQPPEPATVWEKMNAAFHRMLFHDAAGPNTPVPGTLPSIDLARIRAAEASTQADHKPDPPPLSNGKSGETHPASEAASPPEITFDWTPHPTGGLRGDPRIPWSRAPVDPADADPFTAAELSQVRRAFTDLLHPTPAEPITTRPAGRIIELAITPPELKERREKQEGE